MQIIHGDCRTKLPAIPAGSVQLVFADAPFPGIQREYGTWTEEEWFALMDAVMPEVRRVLAPNGSAVIYLKPNSERAGRMRLWLWEFLARWGRKWNIVQDAYAWNYAQLPFGAATTCGLMRGSVAHCIWFGSPDCYRDQGAVLWPESYQSRTRRKKLKPSHTTTFTSASASKRDTDAPRLDQRRAYAAAERRGGVTPFNLIPTTNTKNPDPGNAHPSRTPEGVVQFWVRYLSRPGDTVLDPFAGRGAIGIERKAEYVKLIRDRIAAEKERKRA